MEPTRQLLRETVTLSEAKKRETNMLQQLRYVGLTDQFYRHIEERTTKVEAVVAHHLGLGSGSCHVSSPSEWLRGSFNLCVPVSVEGWERGSGQRVLMRFPLPHKLGESFRPGNCDEKLRCEAATYAWINQECSGVPTAHLWGFGLSTGQRFTEVGSLSFLRRCVYYIKRVALSVFRRPLPSQYVQHQAGRPHELALGTGYLLLDYVEGPRMLSETYEAQRHDTTLRTNLFHDLARIQLSLCQNPFPRIGSLSLDDDGVLGLGNRPGTSAIAQLENDSIPIQMPRNATYSDSETYVRSVLAVHDAQLRHQPNGVSGALDGLAQMAALSTMRSICSDFFDEELRSGPFILCLTDLHASNIFVDDDWHITHIVDLEWACSRPVEMLHPPYWLTCESVDTIDAVAYNEVRAEYMEAFEQEERRLIKEDKPSFHTEVMNRGWERGTFWYCLSLGSLTGMFQIFDRHIQPIYSDSHGEDPNFYSINYRYWTVDAPTFLTKKIEDKEKYDKELEDAFGDDSA